MFKKVIVFITLLFCVGCATNNSIKNNDAERKSISNFAIENDFLYSLDVYNGLAVYDITIEQPKMVSLYKDINGTKLLPNNNYLYVIDSINNDGKITVYNAYNKSTIQYKSEVNYGMYISDAIQNNDYIYAIGYQNSTGYLNVRGGYLKIYEKNKENGDIKLKKEIDISPFIGYTALIKGIIVTNETLLISDTGGGVNIFKNNSDFGLIKSIIKSDMQNTDKVKDIFFIDNILYLIYGNIIGMYNFDGEQQLTTISSISLDRAYDNMDVSLIAKDDNIFFSKDTNVDIQIYDLKNNKLKNVIHINDGKHNILLKNNIMFVATKEYGIYMYDINNIDSINKIGMIE